MTSSLLRAYDRDHEVARPLERGRGRVGHRRAHSSSNHDHSAVVADVRRLPQWTHHVEDGIAGLERIQQVGGLPGRLHHDVDGALLRTRVLDGDRNPLALLINPQDDELPRLLLARDAGRFDNKAFDPRRKKLCMDDFEHRRSIRRMNADSRIVFGITWERL